MSESLICSKFPAILGVAPTKPCLSGLDADPYERRDLRKYLAETVVHLVKLPPEVCSQGLGGQEQARRLPLCTTDPITLVTNRDVAKLDQTLHLTMAILRFGARLSPGRRAGQSRRGLEQAGPNNEDL
ncbi:hypothetical protein DFH09DRAFT_1088056 [Mycena vulgaris]|nr:hypothetical protein DFH09DRAFT_1088056 [Mycena vulgaris]